MGSKSFLLEVPKQSVRLGDILLPYKEVQGERNCTVVSVGRYGIRNRSDIYKKPLSKDYSKNRIIRKDTLTVGLGSRQIDFGILSEDVTYSVSPAYHTYRIVGVASNYLRYHLEAINAVLSRRYMIISCRQGKSVDLKRMMDFEIYIHSRDDQDRIASEFKRLRDLLKNAEERLVLLDQMIRSRFYEMFGDPVANPRLWAVAPLSSRCDIMTGNTPSRAVAANYGSNIEWIKSDNITDSGLTRAAEYLSEIGLLKGRRVDSGAVLMTCIAGSFNSIGNVALTDRSVTFNQQINAIVPKFDNPLFLLWLFKLSRHILHSGLDKGLKGILSKKRLAAKKFPFPPLALQREFAAFVASVDKSKAALRETVATLDQLYRAKLQECFG